MGSLPNLPACTAAAVSQSGNVTGYCLGQIGQTLVSNPTTHAFLYSKGVMKDVNAVSQSTPVGTAVNDSGSVVGSYLTVDIPDGTAGSSLFLYENGLIQPQPQGALQGLLPLALNNAGQYAGTKFRDQRQ